MRVSWIFWILLILFTGINLSLIFLSYAVVKISLKIDKTVVNGIAALSINNIIPIYHIKVRHIPQKLTDTEKDKIRNKRAMQDMIYCRVEIINLIKYLRPKVVLHSMSIKGKVGIDDAFYTAILAPSSGIVLHNIIFNCFCNFDTTPIIEVSPDFDSKSAKGEISCIFKLKIAHSIVMLIKMSKILIKIKHRIKDK